MDANVFEQLVRRYFSKGLSGKEEFELELEASVNHEVKAVLEQAERDDENIDLLARELASTSAPFWYQSKIAAMAASAVLAVGATLFTTNTLVMVSDSSGLATSKLLYLEATRSARVVEPQTVVVSGENEWVTLIASPAYDNFSEFRISVERLTGEGSQSTNLSAASWTQIWESRTDTGNQDALAINIRSDVLDEGIHRLNIEGFVPSSDTYLPAANLLFRITR
ncbi:MAG: hypothetical protein O7G86_14525 [Gammaproteobacteria bacterium]|nr:hypothetical protein [Gammaproteobacteria bacterium]MCZ6855121.1 hypothetical protein [Gammaproteobacteria bacterium]